MDNPASQTDLKSPNFNVDRFLQQTVNDRKLKELVTIEQVLRMEVAGIDNDMRALAFENYGRFLRATDSLAEIRTNYNNLHPTLFKLKAAASRLTTLTQAKEDNNNNNSNSVGDSSESRSTKLQKKMTDVDQLRKLIELSRAPSMLARFTEQLPLSADALVRHVRVSNQLATKIDDNCQSPHFAQVKAKWSEALNKLRVSLPVRGEQGERLIKLLSEIGGGEGKIEHDFLQASGQEVLNTVIQRCEEEFENVNEECKALVSGLVELKKKHKDLFAYALTITNESSNNWVNMSLMISKSYLNHLADKHLNDSDFVDVTTLRDLVSTLNNSIPSAELEVVLDALTRRYSKDMVDEILSQWHDQCFDSLRTLLSDKLRHGIDDVICYIIASFVPPLSMDFIENTLARRNIICSSLMKIISTVIKVDCSDSDRLLKYCKFLMELKTKDLHELWNLTELSNEDHNTLSSVKVIHELESFLNRKLDNLLAKAIWACSCDLVDDTIRRYFENMPTNFIVSSPSMDGTPNTYAVELSRHILSCNQRLLDFLAADEISVENNLEIDKLMNPILRNAFRSFIDFVRSRKFSRSGLHQIQLDVHYINQSIRGVRIDSAVIGLLIDELIVNAIKRCVDPMPLKTTELDEIKRW